MKFRLSKGEIEALGKRYLERVFRDDKYTVRMQFFKEEGVSVKTVQKWAKIYDQFHYCIELAKDKIEERLLEIGIFDQSANVSRIELNLRVNYGYSNREMETETTV